MARILIATGIAMLAVGLFWPWLGKLPGDIVLEKGNFKFYLPITTSILLSILISLASWLLQK